MGNSRYLAYSLFFFKNLISQKENRIRESWQMRGAAIPTDVQRKVRVFRAADRIDGVVPLNGVKLWREDARLSEKLSKINKRRFAISNTIPGRVRKCIQ